MSVMFACHHPQERNIAFLLTTGTDSLDSETRAALQFLQNLSCTILPLSTLESRLGSGVFPLSTMERGSGGVVFRGPGGEVSRGPAILWLHFPDSIQTDRVARDPATLNKISDFVRRGGKLLLTLEAVRLLNDLGLETSPVESRQVNLNDEGYGRKAGLHSYRNHPLFDGLNGGAFILDPAVDTTCRIIGFFGENVPARGKVIAVDWSYIFLREENKLVMQYDHGKGTVLAIGGYTCFTGSNRNRAHLELVMNNAFEYLINGSQDKPVFFWDYGPREVRKVDQPTKAIRIPEGREWTVIPGDITLHMDSAGNDFWDLASPPMVVMGKESHGIEEIWAHPFMALRDLETGIHLEGEDTIHWLQTITPEIAVDPAYIRRVYRLPEFTLNEIITMDPEYPVTVVHYDYKGEKPAKLLHRYCCNLRFMWPYSEKALPGLQYGWDDGLQAMTVEDGSGDFVTIVGSNKKPEQWLSGQFDTITTDQKGFTGSPTKEIQVLSIMQYPLTSTDHLDIVIGSSGEGKESTAACYAEVMEDPQMTLRRMADHYQALPEQYLTINTSSEAFNQGYRWALAGTDRFFVNTPGIGGSLVAGYGTTARGWDGEHRINGRPGYAWYFGRDGQWSGLALLDYGDFEKVRSMLEVYQRFQDLNGKIYHELTTSGVVHYDAADATPLYLVLAGRYLRHSGNLGFIRASWPNIQQAVDFCFSTDTDGDHLIENTGVGHGWVEGGALYGSHTSLYLASCWAAALKEAAYMAEKLGFTVKSSGYITEADCVINIINRDFWNQETGFYRQGKFADGTYLQEPTVLSTMPLYFGQAGADHWRTILEALAGNGFTTNWGVRIISSENRYFNPRAYHSGTVWPLFTGWTALAEYRSDAPIQGYSHIMNNMNVGRYWARGLIEEVLHGLEYRPSGVCAHQCWSETMILQPAIEGMLGLEVSALDDVLELHPRIPFNWDRMTVDNIRIGNQKIKMEMLRNKKTTAYIFSNKGSSTVHVVFEPLMPSGWNPQVISVNGDAVNPQIIQAEQGTAVSLSFDLNDSTVIHLTGDGGIGILPYVTDPKPGEGAVGSRILSASLKDDRYRIVVEGQSGSTGTFHLYTAEDQHIAVQGKTKFEKILGGYKIEINFESSEKPFISKEIAVKLK